MSFSGDMDQGDLFQYDVRSNSSYPQRTPQAEQSASAHQELITSVSVVGHGSPGVGRVEPSGDRDSFSDGWRQLAAAAALQSDLDASGVLRSKSTQPVADTGTTRAEWLAAERIRNAVPSGQGERPRAPLVVPSGLDPAIVAEDGSHGIERVPVLSAWLRFRDLRSITSV